MKSIISYVLILGATSGTLLAADWDPNDDTFDPTIHSVVVGEASWLGDPSPFVHLGLRRTGYTHVNPTDWKGFDPSVQISLMVPKQPGEKSQQGTGMLMMNRSQTLEFLKVVETGLKSAAQQKAKAPKKPKRIRINSAFKDADWALAFVSEKGKRFVNLENKSKGKTNTYRFSINASKKLLGAIKHSLKKVKTKAADGEPVGTSNPAS